MSHRETAEKKRVLKFLDHTCSSNRFGQASRRAKLLRYLVEKTLDGVRLQRHEIATEFFGWENPDAEQLVKVGNRLSHLRIRLNAYNATQGKGDTVVFELAARGYEITWMFNGRQGSPDGAAPPGPTAPILPRSSPRVERTLESLTGNGLNRAFRIKKQNSARLERVTELIEEECRRDRPHFRLAASSGLSYLHPSGVVWCDAGLGEAVINKRARLEVVLESPFSDFAECRALANDDLHHHWQSKVDLAGLQKLVADRPRLVSIDVTAIPVNCSLFFTSTSVFYDPYLWARPNSVHRTENNFWVFEFRRMEELEDDCYGLLTKHFAFLRQHSVSLAEFLAARPSFKRRTDAFERRVKRRIEQARRRGARRKNAHA